MLIKRQRPVIHTIECSEQELRYLKFVVGCTTNDGDRDAGFAEVGVDVWEALKEALGE